MGPTSCPPAGDLELLLVEGLDEPSLRNAEVHVESCATCQMRLDHLVRDSQRDLQHDWPGLPSALGHASSHGSGSESMEHALAVAAEVGSFLRQLRLGARVDGVHVQRPTPGIARPDAPLPHVAGHEILSR